MLLCFQVDRLHIRHAGGEDYYEMAEVENNKITINNFEGDKVEGRLHFKATDSWSLWGSSDSPVSVELMMDFLFILIIYNDAVGMIMIVYDLTNDLIADYGETNLTRDELFASDHHWISCGISLDNYRHCLGGSIQEG